MSIDTGITAVVGRVATIQQRLAVLAPAPRVASASFGQALAGATAALDAGSGLDTRTGVSGDDAVAEARRYLGVPYRWGGTDPATGLDCSGLVQVVFDRLGVHLPRVAADQARSGTPVGDLADARPGDLVAFGSPVDHIGIYAGNGTMVVAPHTGAEVRIQKITRTPTAIRRIVDAPGDPAYPAGATAAARLPGWATTGPGAAYAPLFVAAGNRYGVPPALLAAVARVESGFDPTSVSPAGARGLMQLMPGTARGLGVDPDDPAQAVDGAARLLAGHLREFGSVSLALAAYNAGPGAVHKYGGIPPYAETQAYVPRVLSYAGEIA